MDCGTGTDGTRVPLTLKPQNSDYFSVTILNSLSLTSKSVLNWDYSSSGSAVFVGQWSHKLLLLSHYHVIENNSLHMSTQPHTILYFPLHQVQDCPGISDLPWLHLLRLSSNLSNHKAVLRSTALKIPGQRSVCKNICFCTTTWMSPAFTGHSVPGICAMSHVTASFEDL